VVFILGATQIMETVSEVWCTEVHDNHQ
jgi:hypothetical protein